MSPARAKTAKKKSAPRAASIPSPAAQLDAFLDKFTPDIAAQARIALRRMRARLPGALELVYDNYNALAIGFSPTDRTSDAIFSIALFPRWVSLFFLLNGTRLRDPPTATRRQRQTGSPHQARQTRPCSTRPPSRTSSPRPSSSPRKRSTHLSPAASSSSPSLPRSAPGGPGRNSRSAKSEIYVGLRSDFRITSFNPDHVASTAHTLISTSPSGSATSRTVSSVTSVVTPEAFLGHETQIVPS
jgi:hypothetical protein